MNRMAEVLAADGQLGKDQQYHDHRCGSIYYEAVSPCGAIVWQTGRRPVGPIVPMVLPRNVASVDDWYQPLPLPNGTDKNRVEVG